jgi:hypothetical protein
MLFQVHHQTLKGRIPTEKEMVGLDVIEQNIVTV